MKNTIIKLAAVIILTFGFTTASQAVLLTINMTADNILNDGGLCLDSSCTVGTGWSTLNGGPLANANNWRLSDSLTLDLGAGTHHFAWQVVNVGNPSSGNPAALLAEILWGGNASYSSSSWEVYDQSNGNLLANATEYGNNGGANIWTNVNGGAVSGISTNANWIYTANNFDNADPSAWIRTSVNIPEPSIIALFGLGLLGLGFASSRRRRQ